MELYDCIIVGGGPAGISAAIYLARFNRKTLVIDKKQGRSTFPQINENYLGFPKGIRATRLRQLGRKQAKKYGAKFFFSDVQMISKENDVFKILAKNKKVFFSKTIILATGVKDLFPNFNGYEQCIGHSLLWCITCDGYKTQNKKIIVVGNNDEAAITALQFLSYTDKITFVTNCDKEKCEISQLKIQQLEDHGIQIHTCGFLKVTDTNGFINTVDLECGESIKADFIFSLQGAIPNSDLAKGLGVKCNENGYINITSEQRTNIPHIYAAGDVTRLHSHQIVTAVHEGSMAAQCANYDLYSPEQRE